ncbi:hypothetical protein [Peribacillus frigoritolerans]|uniref:hypothetical protein n=1 Tax=Peribacillus frigoritolerans TaxID=450367 RepID=UPI0020797135|nr:hypothetical protein [Peribacillus frigoritolerans]USK75739.1 hypothetical protein LIT31_03960 [Peribacillus frigoritolerans]
MAIEATNRWLGYSGKRRQFLPVNPLRRSGTSEVYLHYAVSGRSGTREEVGQEPEVCIADHAMEGGRKLTSLKRQIENGDNIAATHSLFEMADDELIELLEVSKYSLILDKVMSPVSRASVSPSEMRILLEKNFICIEENRVEWVASELEYEYGKFDDIRLLAKAGTLFYHRDKFLIWAFPSGVFRAFSQVYVMTYLFEAQNQSYYFKLYDIPYELNSIQDAQSLRMTTVSTIEGNYSS